MEQDKLNEIHKTLEAEKTGVERQLAEYGATVGAARVELPVDEGGFADSAHVTAERSEVLSLIEQLKAQHDELTAALVRIEEGTYGKCERCGDEIPPERLEAIPTARLCVACKQTG